MHEKNIYIRRLVTVLHDIMSTEQNSTASKYSHTYVMKRINSLRIAERKLKIQQVKILRDFIIISTLNFLNEH